MIQHYLLELGGKAAGRLISVSGGNLQIEVPVAKGLPAARVPRQVGTPKYGDIVVEVGLGMSRAFYDWIADSFRKGYRRQHGAVIALDQQWKPSNRMEFLNALVTSVALPELDRSSSKQAVMTVSMKPTTIKYVKPDTDHKPAGHASPRSKARSINHFRIYIPGLEAECAHVSRIGSLTVMAGVKPSRSGRSRMAESVPVSLGHSDLVLTLPQASTEGFQKWYDESVVRGKAGAAERDGTLEFCTPNSSNTYFTVDFRGLGIVSISSIGPGTSKQPIKVVLSCRRMKFTPGAAAIN